MAVHRRLLQPVNTLTSVTGNQVAETQVTSTAAGNITRLHAGTEKERKTEKIVRFASDNESLSDDKSNADSATGSGDIITWIPSEQLYDDDTFISESQKEYSSVDSRSVIPSDPTYGTNTFIDSESEDETRTFSEYSYSDSFASSGVFSSHSLSDRSTSREWREVREIVKDIEELEESVFVRNTDGLHLNLNIDGEDDDIDTTESEGERKVDISKQNFLLNSIRKLKLQDFQSPKSLNQESQFQTIRDKSLDIQGTSNHEISSFCQKMIKSCHTVKSSPVPVSSQDQESKQHVLEFYGLSSRVMDKIKTVNFQHSLAKKLADLEEETEKSLEYVRNYENMETLVQEQQFINQMKACVLKEKMDDCIQAHLIKMHPVKWFCDLINDLPKMDEDTREILYKYKRQVKNRINGNG